MSRATQSLLLVAALSACSGGQRWATLDDLPTDGGVLRGCRMGYRTYGRLDPGGNNAVLLVPWLLGTSRQLAKDVGSSSLVDDGRFFVVAVDAPGNGVSCSPSSSTLQPGQAFPRLGITDLVQAEKQLLTRTLGIRHLRAVIGKSMGGMQALAWAATEPGFIDAAVTIVGSPRSTELDRLFWEGAVQRVRASSRWKRTLQALGRLAPAQAAFELSAQADDFALQAEAIQHLDLTTGSGGSLERLAAGLRPRLLVMVSEHDEVVDPAPARELARLTGAELVVLDGRCGHGAPSCERERVASAVRRFLAPP